jgi:hypothetical protein
VSVRKLTLLLALAFATSAPARARADNASDRQACAVTYEAGQRLERERKFVEARQNLLTCSRSCTATFAQECLGWLHEVDVATPSVVLVAKTSDGHDVEDVAVALDGRRFADRLDGKALDLDPGEHSFRFTPARGKAVLERFVIREGEKAREIAVVLDEQPSVAASATIPTDETVARRPIPSLAWVLAGVGVVGMGTFAYFGITGRSEQDSTLKNCFPTCSPSQTDDVLRKYIAADVSLGISLAALGVATVLVLTRPTRRVARAGVFTPALGFSF